MRVVGFMLTWIGAAARPAPTHAVLDAQSREDPARWAVEVAPAHCLVLAQAKPGNVELQPGRSVCGSNGSTEHARLVHEGTSSMHAVAICDEEWSDQFCGWIRRIP